MIRFYSEHTINIGVPCSDIELKSVVPCTRENEAVAFACGVQLGGGNPLVFMQNSGLGNCLDTLTTLYYPYGFDFEWHIWNRKDLHHSLMGEVAPKIARLIHNEAKRSNT